MDTSICFFCWDVDPQSLHGARCGWIESNGNDVGARIGSGFEDVQMLTVFLTVFSGEMV
jgi:hypothetical protein